MKLRESKKVNGKVREGDYNFLLVSSNSHPLIQHQHCLIPNLEQYLLYSLQILLIHLPLLHHDHKYGQWCPLLEAEK
jgi:hypothetical protein